MGGGVMMGSGGLWKSFHFFVVFVFWGGDFGKQFVKLSCFEIRDSEGGF